MRRNRDRENAGKSARSHEKHGLIRKAVQGQVFAFHTLSKGRGRILLIDGNAGDGEGVPEDQADLFGDNPSCATAELMVTIGHSRANIDVVLCEKNPAKRSKLIDRFPNITIIPDHKDAPDCVTRFHIYALWLSDPCGPAEQGIEPMSELAKRIKSDFVATFNEGFLIRLKGTKAGWETSKELYLPRERPEWWMTTLQRRHMARTRLIKGSESFHYRVLVISNFLTDPVKRRPFEVYR